MCFGFSEPWKLLCVCVCLFVFVEILVKVCGITCCAYTKLSLVSLIQSLVWGTWFCPSRVGFYDSWDDGAPLHQSPIKAHFNEANLHSTVDSLCTMYTAITVIIFVYVIQQPKIKVRERSANRVRTAQEHFFLLLLLFFPLIEGEPVTFSGLHVALT